MSLDGQAHSNILILATILSASSLASTSILPAILDTSPDHLPRIPDLPPWSPSPPPARLDRNLQDSHHPAKAISSQAYPDRRAEAIDQSHDVLPATDAETRLGRRTLSEREPNVLARKDRGVSLPSMTHELSMSSEWFQPSAPTNTAPPVLIPELEDTTAYDTASSAGLLDCNWLDGTYTSVIGVLVFAVTAAGTMFVLRLLWRQGLRARRRAREEGIGLELVRRELETLPGNES